MTVPDTFSAYYADLLQGSYDCLDRIVLHAFYPLGNPEVGCALGGGAYRATIQSLTMLICVRWRGPFHAASRPSARSRSFRSLRRKLATENMNWRKRTYPKIRIFADCFW